MKRLCLLCQRNFAPADRHYSPQTAAIDYYCPECSLIIKQNLAELGQEPKDYSYVYVGPEFIPPLFEPNYLESKEVLDRIIKECIPKVKKRRNRK